MIIWIRNTLSPQQIHDRLMSDDSEFYILYNYNHSFTGSGYVLWFMNLASFAIPPPQWIHIRIRLDCSPDNQNHLQWKIPLHSEPLQSLRAMHISPLSHWSAGLVEYGSPQSGLRLWRYGRSRSFIVLPVYTFCIRKTHVGGKIFRFLQGNWPIWSSRYDSFTWPCYTLMSLDFHGNGNTNSEWDWAS